MNVKDLLPKENEIAVCTKYEVRLPVKHWFLHPIYKTKWNRFYIYIDSWEFQEGVWRYDWGIFEDKNMINGIDYGIEFQSKKDALNGLIEYLQEQIKVIENEIY